MLHFLDIVSLIKAGLILALLFLLLIYKIFKRIIFKPLFKFIVAFKFVQFFQYHFIFYLLNQLTRINFKKFNIVTFTVNTFNRMYFLCVYFLVMPSTRIKKSCAYMQAYSLNIRPGEYIPNGFR